jgi:hypothetical protein
MRPPSYQRNACVPSIVVREQLGKHVPEATEAKEFPVLEAATKELHVKTQQTAKTQCVQ